MIKLPRVIDDNGKEVKRLHPIAESISEKLVPLSYATMQVTKSEAVDGRTYIELYNVNGFCGVYRTRSPQEDCVGDTVTLQLEHAISEVGDWLVQDAIDEESTVRNAFVTLFNHYRGSKWQLGSFTATQAVHLDVDYDNILESMINIIQQAPQYYMTFDFSTSPWTVSLATKPNEVSAEGRLSRNIESVLLKRDDKDLCTRVYVKGLPKPVGREDDENAIGYMDADTQALYGIVEAQTGSGDMTQAQATRVAQTYLANHKHPKFTLEVNGYDFSSATGETIDRVATAKKYRLAIPSKSVIVEDYITALNWNDVYGVPESVDIVVGEEQDAVIDFYKEQQSAAKSSKRSSKKQEKQNDAFIQQFEKTDEYGAILEQAGMKLDSHGLLYYARDNVNNIGAIIESTASTLRSEIEAGDDGLRSVIMQTATNVYIQVDSAKSDMHSRIEETASSIEASVWAAKSALYTSIMQTSTNIYIQVGNAKSDMHASIEATASSIQSDVWAAKSSMYTTILQTATGIYQGVMNDGLQTIIVQTSTNIYTQVGNAKSGLYSYIDQTISSITLSADQIYLDGDTKLSGALSISNGNLNVSKTAYFGSNVYITGDHHLILQTSGTPATNYDLSPTIMANMIVKAQVDSNTNTLKLWTITDAASSPSITFSKAVTSDKVSGSWSNGTLTVSSDPLGSSLPFVRTLSHSMDTSGSSPVLKIQEMTSGTPPTYTDTGHNISMSTYLDSSYSSTAISTNGTYTPGSSKIGFSSVKVNVAPTISSISSNGSTEPSGISGLGTLTAQSVTSSPHWFLVTASAGGSTKPYKLKMTPTTETKSITSNGTYTPSSGKVGFSSVTVNVTATHSPTATISDNGSSEPSGISGLGTLTAQSVTNANHWFLVTASCGGSSKPYKLKMTPARETKTINSNGTYTPSSGKVGFSSVTVSVPEPTIGISSSTANVNAGSTVTVYATKNGSNVTSAKCVVTARSIGYITTDASNNHNGDWWNFRCYTEKNGTLVCSGQTNASTLGMYVPGSSSSGTTSISLTYSGGTDPGGTYLGDLPSVNSDVWYAITATAGSGATARFRLMHAESSGGETHTHSVTAKRVFTNWTGSGYNSNTADVYAKQGTNYVKVGTGYCFLLSSALSITTNGGEKTLYY